MKINSTNNFRLKEILKIRKNKKLNDNIKIIVEGDRELSLAMASGVEILEFYFSKKYSQGKEKKFLTKQKTFFELSPEAFDKISLRQHPDGILAIVKIKNKKLTDLKITKTPLLLVLESPEKPGNIGAILRTAEAGAIDAVIISNPQTFVYGHNVIRASQGSIFNIPIFISNNQEILDFFQKYKINSFATTPQASINYLDANYKQASAIIMGTEDSGLSDFWLQNATQNIKIMMSGKIDSLNLSVSTAIILFEALRQRK